MAKIKRALLSAAKILGQGNGILMTGSMARLYLKGADGTLNFEVKSGAPRATFSVGPTSKKVSPNKRPA